MAAPPSYSAATSLGQPSQPSGSRIRKLRFAEIPPHLLLNVVYATLPQTPGVDESAVERQRRVLYWMSMNLRLVNRPFYVACMHVLRSIYLRTYERLIRPPYTSDPFPVLSPAPSYEESTSSKQPAASSSSPTAPSSALLTPFPDTLPRETRVLDQFIALKVREDAWADATSLHLERDEGYKDLFDLMQPRARLEDLICQYAVREGIVSFAGSSRPASPTGSTSELSRHPRPIPFRLLTVTFSPWRVGLAITLSSRRKTIVEVQRGARDESLERAAKRVVRELRVWAAENWR